jgi:hypothetical protein
VTSSAVVATGQPRSNADASRPEQVRDRRGDLVPGAPDRLRPDLLLAAWEVVIERAPRRLAALEQLVQPGAVIALALQEIDRGIQQPVAARRCHSL